MRECLSPAVADYIERQVACVGRPRPAGHQPERPGQAPLRLVLDRLTEAT